MANSPTLAGKDFRSNVGLDFSSTNELKTAFTDNDGKRIYRKKIDFGALPNATTKDVPHSITNLNVAKGAHARIFGTVSDGTTIENLTEGYGTLTLFGFNATNVTIAATGDESGSNAVVFLEYTKTA